MNSIGGNKGQHGGRLVLFCHWNWEGASVGSVLGKGEVELGREMPPGLSWSMGCVWGFLWAPWSSFTPPETPGFYCGQKEARWHGDCPVPDGRRSFSFSLGLFEGYLSTCSSSCRQEEAPGTSGSIQDIQNKTPSICLHLQVPRHLDKPCLSSPGSGGSGTAIHQSKAGLTSLW